jgi:hypothetical protein
VKPQLKTENRIQSGMDAIHAERVAEYQKFLAGGRTEIDVSHVWTDVLMARVAGEIPENCDVLIGGQVPFFGRKDKLIYVCLRKRHSYFTYHYREARLKTQTKVIDNGFVEVILKMEMAPIGAGTYYGADQSSSMLIVHRGSRDEVLDATFVRELVEQNYMKLENAMVVALAEIPSNYNYSTPVDSRRMFKLFIWVVGVLAALATVALGVFSLVGAGLLALLIGWLSSL